MELVSTVIIYKFTHLSRDEVYAMLSYTIDELRQTRVYQDTKAEGHEEAIRDLVLTQLQTKLGQISSAHREPIRQLNLDRLHDLTTALLNFGNINDLEQWLAK